MPSPLIAGRFEPHATISEGALTRILAATDRDGAAVVVKRLQRHLLWDRQCIEMLRHEGRLTEALAGEGIARVIARGDDDDGPYLALEALPGETLAQRAPADVMAVARGLLRVLDRVHLAAAQGVSLRVVHRDVCPANVLRGPDGAVTLLDFGIATSAWRQDPDRGVMKGTRGYMAPEAITGEHELGPPADLFAAGVILTELFAGRRLFEGAFAAVLDDIVDGPVRGPNALGAQVPDHVDAALRRALARHPGDRFARACDMLAALDAGG